MDTVRQDEKLRDYVEKETGFVDPCIFTHSIESTN
jgi:hypothetical protein